MSISGTFKLTMPNDVIAELYVKAPVGEWREMRKQLTDQAHWPTCDFVRLLDDLLARADRAWWQTSKNLEDKSK